MRYQLLVAAAAATLSSQALAVTLPNTFSSGQPANASEVNANFEALATAIDNAGSTQFGSQYFLAPSSTGDLGSRNVIVLKEDRGGTSGGCSEDVYRVRAYFTNTNNLNISNASGTLTNPPDRIFIFGFVCANRGTGTVNYQSEYVYGLPTASNNASAFDQALGVEINEDFTGDGSLTDQNNAYNYRQSFRFNPLAASELTHSTEMYTDASGETLAINSFSYIMSPLGQPLTVNGETYNDVGVRHFLHNNRTRYHANGIGVVQEVNNSDNSFADPVYSDNQTISRAIFYRIEGGSSFGSGNLTGTPFESGNASAGLWFQ